VTHSLRRHIRDFTTICGMFRPVHFRNPDCLRGPLRSSATTPQVRSSGLLSNPALRNVCDQLIGLVSPNPPPSPVSGPDAEPTPALPTPPPAEQPARRQWADLPPATRAAMCCSDVRFRCGCTSGAASRRRRRRPRQPTSAVSLAGLGATWASRARGAHRRLGNHRPQVCRIFGRTALRRS
jgi:hypothetical protein